MEAKRERENKIFKERVLREARLAREEAEEEASSSSSPCLGRAVPMNGYLDERRRIGMALDELVLETGSCSLDMRANGVNRLGDSCFSCIGPGM